MFSNTRASNSVCCCRHAECLTEADSDDALPYCIAGGNVTLAVQHLIGRGHLLDAVLVAVSADEGGMPSSFDKPRQALRTFQTEETEPQTRCCSCAS